MVKARPNPARTEASLPDASATTDIPQRRETYRHGDLRRALLDAGVALARKDFQPRFSVDKSATTYRVEVYKGKAFAGMLLVRFGQAEPGSKEPLTATKGPESALGF